MFLMSSMPVLRQRRELLVCDPKLPGWGNLARDRKQDAQARASLSRWNGECAVYLMGHIETIRS